MKRVNGVKGPIITNPRRFMAVIMAIKIASVFAFIFILLCLQALYAIVRASVKILAGIGVVEGGGGDVWDLK